MIDYGIKLLSNIFEVYIAVSFFDKVGTRKFKSIAFWGLCGLFALFQFANNNVFLKESSLVMVGSFIFLCLISFLYKMKFLSKIFSNIFLFVLIASSEFVVAMISTIFLKADISYIQDNIYLFGICTIASKFLAFAIVRLLEYKGKKQKNWLPFALALKTIPLSAATFLVMILFYTCAYRIEDSYFRILSLVASILLIFANIFVFYIIDKQNDYIATKEKLKYTETHMSTQISHYEELYKYQNELRKYRHDSTNRNLAVIGLIRSEKYAEALNELTNTNEMFEREYNEFVFTNNPVIDSVIRAKKISANSKDITLVVHPQLPLQINIDPIEISVIIGNALDNAIEATVQVNDAPKEILLEIATNHNDLTIGVTNPVVNDVDVNNLTSTKKNKLNHGFGLASIEYIAQKYHGHVFYTCENKQFEISIIMKN